MKKNILKLTAACMTMMAMESSAQSVSYSYVRNNPYDIKNFTFAIDPFFTEVNGHNGGNGSPGFAFGWGIRGEHMMGKTLLANFDLRTAFGTSKFRKSNDNTKNYFNMEGGVGLIFAQRVKTRNVPIVLSSHTSGNTRYTVSIRGGVPAKCRLIVAFRAGFQQYNNTLDYNSKSIYDSLLTFNGGAAPETYTEVKKDNSKFFKDSVNGQFVVLDQLGAIAITSIYAGIQFRTIRDLVIDVDGYGLRGNVRYSDFYIDAMFAPIIAMRDFRGQHGDRYDVKYENMSNFGWRFGWFWRKPKEQGFSTKLEIGSRPGFKAPTNTNVPINMKNMYCTLTFGLYIPLKLKPMYTGDSAD